MIQCGDCTREPCDNSCGCFCHKFDALQAENERMREALREADFLTVDDPNADYGSGPECTYCYSRTAVHRASCEWWTFRKRLVLLARAAKAEKEPGK